MNEFSAIPTEKILPPADWTSPLATYFIACSPRSGSTFFCSTLHRTNFLGYPDEYFNDVVTRNAGRMDPTILNQCIHAARDGVSPNGICGIKLMIGKMPDILERIILEEWFPEPKWIWLRRRDKLAQAISYDKAQQTNSWSSFQDPEKEPSYSRESISNRIAELEENDEWWTAYSKANSIKFLEVWYEDFILDQPGTINMISHHIGAKRFAALDDAPPRPSYFENISIQGDTVNAEWKRRYLSGK